jgi:hypothetical protein
MKKIYTLPGILLAISILVSAVTAVPAINSEPTLKIINNVEQKKLQLDEKFSNYAEQLQQLFPTIKPKGIILDIILAIINLINKIIQLLIDIMKLGDLILALIEAITLLFEVFMQFVEWLRGIFNPSFN